MGVLVRGQPCENGWSNRQKKSYRTTPGFFQLEENQRSPTGRIYNPNSPVSPGFPYRYTSSDPTETYAVFDVSTPVADLAAGYGIGSLAGQAIFSDLGSGQNFGMTAASLADNGKFVEIAVDCRVRAAWAGRAPSCDACHTPIPIAELTR